MDNIVLIGMPGSGKSSTGVVLAKALGMDFIDGDLLIQAREGMRLQEILDTRGTQSFLDLEGEALTSLQCQKTVIAPGGSCVCRHQTMAHLQTLGRVVYLRLTYRQMASRIHDLATRGIALEPGQTLQELYDLRAPLYEEYAHLTVDVGERTLGETVQQLIALLN